MVFRITQRFIPLAFLTTVLCGLVYISVQHSLRTGANDPQIQMAEDGAAQVENGVFPPIVIGPSKVDISTSLSPYLVVYNSSREPIAGNGMLDGALPGLPPGVFDYVAAHGEDRLTWQPRPGVRQAIVVTRITGINAGFAMAGRSLREVEVREDHAQLEAASVWLLAIGGLFLIEVFFALISGDGKRKK